MRTATDGVVIEGTIPALTQPKQFISRQYIQMHRDTLFLFGDNVEQRGMGGMARDFRGEPNTHGIPTKWAPTMEEQDFFSDKNYFNVCDAILKQLLRIPFKMSAYSQLFIPVGIGLGLAHMSERAPSAYSFMLAGFHHLRTKYKVIDTQ